MAIKGGLFRIRQIDIHIRNSNDTHAFQRWMGGLESELKNYRQQNIWSVHLDELAKGLARVTWIQSFEIVRHYPNTLVIELETVEPIALYLNNSGELALLGKRGELLPPILKDEALELPLVQVNALVQRPDTRGKIAALLNQLPREGKFSLKNMSDVFLGTTGDIWLTHARTHSQIRLGEQNIPIRSARVSKVVDYLESNKLNWRVIDADYSKKVLVRLRNDR